MSQDPFYEQILAGLKGTLNPHVFEECMADLLREAFPTLVPVHGGKDSGMDGAIADGEGEPYPLVTTTAKDVRRNLRKSINSFLKRRQPARKVVFATSQSLTPQRQLGLKDLAREKGFKLVHLVEQRGVANLLYNSPRWCKQLLDLSGQPSALSVVPRTRRPLLDLDPIGRDRDLEWLRQTTGDRILSGEPGSGKTFLLYHLARCGWGLFLVDPDGGVAGALREQRPSAVIVDDAHAQPEILVKLRQLRQQTKMEFSIVATTWEGARDQVIEAMGGIPEDRVRKLELLTRSQILEVFQSVGVQEDPGTMRYLIDQAANKPGLAVTIATLWLAGSWREVIDGKVLSRTLLAFFQEFVGREAIDVLAAFSLGGDQGMGTEAVREFLGLSRLQVRQIASGLAAGGVVSEVGKDILAVWPRPLRSALIRTTFFPPPGQPRHPYWDLVGKAPNLGRAAEALVASKAVGADIPIEELREIVAGSGSPRAWNGLAQLSEQDALWVLKNYSGDVVEIGGSTLLRAPESTVDNLLKRAVSATGPTHSNPNHPMRILANWVRELNLPVDQMIWRRRLLARVSKRYILQNGQPSVGINGICLALSPSMESRSLDPGVGLTLTISSGLLRIDKIPEFEGIWEDSRDALTVIDASAWDHISAMLWEWLYPEYSARSAEVPEETKEAMQAFAAKLLRDFVPLTQGSPGLAAGLQALAAKIGIELPLGRDSDFEKLYPYEEYEDARSFEAQEAIQRAAVKDLAAQWVQGSPPEVATKVVGYEGEAKKINRNWPRRTPDLCRDLAAIASEPDVWLDAFIQESAPSDLVEPFLRATLVQQRCDAEQILDQCLKSDLYIWLATEFVLQMPEPPPHLLKQVLERVVSFPRLVETLCLRGEVSLLNIKTLLEHPVWEVALAAAVGEWLSDPKGEIRAEIAQVWRDAVLRSKPDEYSGMRYWLGEIFKETPGIAHQWLSTRLEEEPDRIFLAEEGPFSKAIYALSQGERIRVLDDLGNRVLPQPLISLLVDKDPVVYLELLGLQDLSQFHQEPLAGIPDEKWAELAMMALESGYDARSIAQAAFHPAGISVSWGSESMHWSQWDEAFARLEEDPRGEIQEVARYGREIAQASVQKAREKERQEALHGI